MKQFNGNNGLFHSAFQKPHPLNIFSFLPYLLSSSLSHSNPCRPPCLIQTSPTRGPDGHVVPLCVTRFVSRKAPSSKPQAPTRHRDSSFVHYRGAGFLLSTLLKRDQERGGARRHQFVVSSVRSQFGQFGQFGGYRVFMKEGACVVRSRPQTGFHSGACME